MATGQYESRPPKQTLLNAVFCACDLRYGLTYQSCRFCKASYPNVEGLWKYAVRHYICSACRNKVIRP